MVTGKQTGAAPVTSARLLDREHTIAKPGFNRWLVPPAALATLPMSRQARTTKRS